MGGASAGMIQRERVFKFPLRDWPDFVIELTVKREQGPLFRLTGPGVDETVEIPRSGLLEFGIHSLLLQRFVQAQVTRAWARWMAL